MKIIFQALRSIFILLMLLNANNSNSQAALIKRVPNKYLSKTLEDANFKYLFLSSQDVSKRHGIVLKMDKQNGEIVDSFQFEDSFNYASPIKLTKNGIAFYKTTADGSNYFDFYNFISKQWFSIRMTFKLNGNTSIHTHFINDSIVYYMIKTDYLKIDVININQKKVTDFSIVNEKFLFLDTIGETFFGVSYRDNKCYFYDILAKRYFYDVNISNANSNIYIFKQFQTKDFYNLDIDVRDGNYTNDFKIKINRKTLVADTFSLLNTSIKYNWDSVGIIQKSLAPIDSFPYVYAQNIYDVNTYKPIVRHGALANINFYIGSKYGKFITVYHSTLGWEMAFISNDTIRLIDDFSDKYLSSTIDPNYVFNNNVSYSINDSVNISIFGRDKNNVPFLSIIDPYKIKPIFVLENSNNQEFKLYDILGYEDSHIFYSISQLSNNIEDKRYFELFKRNINNTDSFEAKIIEKAKENKVDTWFKSFGLVDKRGYYSGNNVNLSAPITHLNKDGSIIISCFYINHSDYAILHPDTTFESNFNRNQLLIKYDRFGNLIWQKNFGGHYYSLPYYRCTVDKDGNIIVAGSFIKDFIFNNFTKTAYDDRCETFVLKINGKTGDLMWYKTISSTYYSNEIQPEQIVADKDNNYYIAIFSDNFDAEVFGKTIYGLRNKHNILAKIDSAGNLFWVNSIITPWLDYAGNTTILTIDTKTNLLATVQSQGSYATSSSCKYQNWQNYLQIIDGNGNILKTKNYVSTDLGGAMVATFNDYSKLLVHGYYRAEIAFDEYKFSTKKNAYCFNNEQFYFNYDLSLNKVIHAQSFGDSSFFPYEIKVVNDIHYILGFDDEKRISIKKYNQFGNYLGKKRFNEKMNETYSYGRFYSFDVNDSFLVMSTDNWRDDSTKGIYPLPFDSYARFGVLKMKNDNWELPSSKDPLSDENATILFPNPTSNYIYIKSGMVTNKFAIYAQDGRLLREGVLKENEITELDVSTMKVGLYFMVLKNDKTSETIKFEKH